MAEIIHQWRVKCSQTATKEQTKGRNIYTAGGFIHNIHRI